MTEQSDTPCLSLSWTSGALVDNAVDGEVSAAVGLPVLRPASSAAMASAASTHASK